MLLKIFVTIMSMVSLTLQMDSSDAGPSSNSSPLWAHDKERDRYYPSTYNLFNPFDKTTVAHVCFAFIALYCRTGEIITHDSEVPSLVAQEYPIISSHDCVKNGIFFYKVTQTNEIIPEEYEPISWLDEFFFSFKLDIGEIKYPKEFCVKEEDGTVDSDCLAELQAYSAEIQTTDSKNPSLVGMAIYASRSQIALLALRYKVTLGLPEKSFEKKYLEHISENVSSLNVFHDPYNYCVNYNQRAHGLKISKFLVEHLGLQYY